MVPTYFPVGVLEIFVDKFRPVLKDDEILDEWIKEQDEIGTVVKEHADIIRTKALKFTANLPPFSTPAKDTSAVNNHSKWLKNVLAAPRNPSPLPPSKEKDSSKPRSFLPAPRGTPDLQAGKDPAPSWVQNILPLPRHSLLQACRGDCSTTQLQGCYCCEP